MGGQRGIIETLNKNNQIFRDTNSGYRLTHSSVTH